MLHAAADEEKSVPKRRAVGDFVSPLYENRAFGLESRIVPTTTNSTNHLGSECFQVNITYSINAY
jgi:hypothetical protein